MAHQRTSDPTLIVALRWASVVFTAAASVSTAILGVIYVCNTVLQLRSPFPQHSPISFPIIGRAAQLLQAMLWIGVMLAVLAFGAESVVQVAREQFWKRSGQRTPVHRRVASGAMKPPSARPIWRRVALGLAAVCIWVFMPPSVFNVSGVAVLRGVAIVSQGEAWVVGTFKYNYEGDGRGIIWHYTQGHWAMLGFGVGTSLNAIAVLPTGDGWAVGAAGALYHLHDGQWTPTQSQTTDDLLSVAMLSSGDAWSVGGTLQPYAASTRPSQLARLGAPTLPSAVESQFGPTTCRILHYVAGSWKSVSCPTHEELASISMLPDGEAWSVGTGGAILHESGGQWVAVHSPTSADLEGVSMASPEEGWAVGYGALLHFTHGTWVALPVPASAYLHCIVGLPAGAAWAGGYGLLLHATGSAWAPYPDVSVEGTLWGLTTTANGTTGWAVGASDQGPLVLRYEAGMWATVPVRNDGGA